MAVCISPYIPRRKPWETSTLEFSYEVFFSFCTVLEMGLHRTWYLTLQSKHCPRALHCQSICICVEVFPVSEYHQYHLQLVILLNRSQIQSLQSRAALTALGDSRGYSYRRPALVLVLFCSPSPALTARNIWTPAECSVRMLHSLYVQIKRNRWGHSFISL